jgi:cytochrome P450
VEQPSFCTHLHPLQKSLSFTDERAAYITGLLYEAGSDTTSATLIGFVQAMLLHPEVQTAAREELDRVCGTRLPSIDDEPDLPYIRCCIKESLRWMPAAILGIPHAVIRDDEYRGYKIPKGATVIYNVW